MMQRRTTLPPATERPATTVNGSASLLAALFAPVTDQARADLRVDVDRMIGRAAVTFLACFVSGGLLLIAVAALTFYNLVTCGPR